MKSKVSTFLFVCISTIQPSFSNELPLTETQLYATLGVVTGFILNDENADEIVHKGITYGIITSPSTNKVWLDRNLGATQVCSAATDTACYGDYYQWGRKADGHQNTNTTDNVQATDPTDVGHGRFITSPVGAWVEDSIDDDGSIRRATWSSTAGSNICPIDFRVPTYTELRAELLNTIIDSDSAFTSILKLPSSGTKSFFSGVLINEDSNGGLWTGTGGNGGADYLEYRPDRVIWGEGNIGGASTATGLPVRCIKN